MATDVEKLDFQISATDKASAVFRGAKGAMEDLQGSYSRLLGVMGVSIPVTAFGAFVVQTVKVRSALDDLSDTTGDAVKTLDGLRRQAEISGIEFDQMGGSLSKFARNLNAADDEGKAASSALEALGFNLEEIRAKKPAEAMIEVAKALYQFEDGASKVAVAVALMGKEGARMLPYLKDIAEAGGVSGRITAEQAAEAEKLEKQWRGLIQTLKDGREAMANLIIPKLGNWVEQLQEGIRLFGGIGGAVLNIGMAIDPSKPLGANMSATRKQLEQLKAEKANFAKQGEDTRWYDQQIERVSGQLEFMKLMERQRALAGSGAGQMDARDLALRQKPALNWTPPSKAGGGEKKNEVEAFLRALEQEEIKKNAVLRVTEVLRTLDTERYKNATPAERARAVAIAEQIDLREAERKASEAASADEARGWREVGEEIERLKAAEDARIKGLVAHYNDIIDPMARYRRELADIEELVRLTYLTEEQAAVARSAVFTEMEKAAGVFRDTVKDSIDWGREMGLTFSSAAEDAIVRFQSLRSVLLGVIMDIGRIVARKTITEPIGSGVSSIIAGFLSKGGSGTTLGADDAAALGNIGVPGRALGGPVAAGMPYEVGENGPELFRPSSSGTVVPNGRTGGDTYYIDARGADAAGLARVEAQIRQLNGSIEHRAVSATARAARNDPAVRRALQGA